MTVADVNLALDVLGADRVYGLQGAERGRATQPSHQPGHTVCESIPALTLTDAGAGSHNIIDLASYACHQLPQYPLLPEAHFHWLAVQGAQPSVPQNPEVVVYDSSADTTGLPREVAYFYTKLTHLVLSATAVASSGQSVREACALLKGDGGLQPLAGYLCRFVFVQIRRNLKNTHVLYALLQVIQSLVLNASLNVEGCLHQLLPSLLSCIVGAKIGAPSPSVISHCVQFPVRHHHIWSELQPVHVRQFGAVVVQSVLARYSPSFPDLLPRVCKTYLQAATTSDSSGMGGALSGAAAVRYGGIMGLGMLGERAVREVLLPNINAILLNVASASRAHTVAPDASSGPPPVQSLIGRKGHDQSTLSSRNRSAAHIGEADEEVLLMSILSWYIRHNMRSEASLDFLSRLRSIANRNSISCSAVSVPEKVGYSEERKRRRVQDHALEMIRGCSWDQFVDRNIERFVPHFVASSSLQQCSGLFI